MADSDVEFEDEWEEVQPPATVNGAEDAAAGDITISLTAGDGEAETGGKKRRSAAGRTYTKQEREDALQVHRVHCLCLLAHALLHDQAASSSELQALLLSLLPADLIDATSAAATSEDPSAAAWLPSLLRWFHRTFTATAAPHIRAQQKPSSAEAAACVTGSMGSGWQHELMQDLGLGLGFVPVQQQLLGCVVDRRGSCEQLAALLVALLRGVGFLTRSVWSLEPLPFKPAAVQALQRSRSTGSMKSRAAPAPAHAALAAAAAPATAGSKPGKKRSRTAVPTGSAAAAVEDGSASVDGTGGNATGSRERQHRRGSGKQPAKQPAAAATAAAEQAEEPSKQRAKRKGDEEFELQLAMAMASTAAEAEGRAQAQTAAAAAAAEQRFESCGSSNKRSGLPSHPSQSPNNAASRPPSGLGTGTNPKPQGSTGRESVSALINRGASHAALKAGAQQAAAATPKGWLWAPNPAGLGSVPRVWSEVYIGSSADGRWLHVDGQLGCWDQPGVVEAATARQQPLTYVVACQAGAPKDVTRRYAANFTLNVKGRDEAWWASTMAALRSSVAHLPKHLAAQMAGTAAAAAAPESVLSAPALQQPAKQQDHHHHLQQQQQHQHQPAPKRRRAQQQQQQQQQDTGSEQQQCGHQEPPTLLHQAAPSAAAAVATAAAATAAAAGSDVPEAVLRAAREDEELAARAARQAAGPPTTIEGFKNHPLYILERHIQQKQALVPGAARLGLHKGEPYYSRKDVQELHTRAHWRRQGRDVKESELPHPAKQAKKRKVPSVLSTGGGSAGFAGWGGGTRGGSHRGPGGWGPWQRGKAASGAGRGAGAAGDADECDGELPAPAAAAAAGSGPAAAGGESTDMQLLYGLWQTEEWEPPPAVDGKVPRNEHGNVEVPPFAKVLPTGTKHIALPNTAAVCRSLGIDYAPALVGFEVQGGRNLPKILGVVVCEEFEDAVVQLYLQRQTDKAAAEAERQRKEVESAWRRLLGSMWTRLQLQRKYGTDASAVTSDLLAPAAVQRHGSSASDIVGRLHAAAAEEQQQVATSAAIAATAAAAEDDTAAGQQAARARGGRPPRKPPGVAAAVAAAVTGRGDAAAAQAGIPSSEGLRQQHGGDEDGMEGVEVEEF